MTDLLHRMDRLQVWDNRPREEKLTSGGWASAAAMPMTCSLPSNTGCGPWRSRLASTCLSCRRSPVSWTPYRDLPFVQAEVIHLAEQLV